MPVSLAVAIALGGALLDFVFNGVFKVVWMAIYVPAYIVAANVLAKRLATTRHQRHTRVAVVALLGGALAAHLALTGLRSQVIYPMHVTSSNPITLRSNDWPQSLIVASDKLSKQLAGVSATQDIPVVIERVLDYGCTRTAQVQTVAGVDVRLDPQATWTWKTDPQASAPAIPRGPGYEDQRLAWCRISFYRSTN